MDGFVIPDRVVGIAGDWHGNGVWAVEALKALHAAGVSHIFHLGDFGFWSGVEGEKYVSDIHDVLEETNMMLYVTAGNHEDYPLIFSKPVDSFGLNVFSDRLKVFSRGFTGNIGGVSFMSLGGANSIDFKHRTEYVDWWRDEQISVKDFDVAVSAGQKTIMFCHDCPDGVEMFSIRKSWRAGWSTDELNYSAMSRKVLREVINYVKPEVLFHGHHHVFQDVKVGFDDLSGEKFTVRAVGLNREYTNTNVGVYDVVSGIFSLVDVPDF